MESSSKDGPGTERRGPSLFARLALLVTVIVGVTVAVQGAATKLGLPPLGGAAVTAMLVLPLALWGAASFWRPVKETVQAVTDGVRSFKDGDFGLRLARTRQDELGELVSLTNDIGNVLRLERSEIYQRELLLDSVLQGAPMAIVLLNERARVLYANLAARKLLGDGKRLHGRFLHEVVAASPLREALAAREDGLYTVASPKGDDEIYRIVRRPFQLNTQRQELLVVERITPELKRQEVATWKKVIRVLSHELNNSLAPISSLVHSARHVANLPEKQHRTDEILGTIADRVKHLTEFLASYAELARLPAPRPRDVAWRPFLDGVADLFPFRLEVRLSSETGFFDPTQLQQVLINLLKNAEESGSPKDEILVTLVDRPDHVALSVLDRGKGMDEETMKNALLPFYSTKPSGTGLGLALANEVVLGHRGTLGLRARAGGGMSVTCELPRNTKTEA